MKKHELTLSDIVDPRLQEPHNPDAVPLSAQIEMVLSRWRMVLAIVVSVFSIGVLYAVFATPIYSVDAMIQVADSTADNKMPLQSLANLLDGGSSTAAELELVKSRKVIDSVVDKLHLNIVAEPDYLPVLGKWIARRHRGSRVAAPMFGLDGYAWGGEKIDVDRLTVLSGTGSEADNDDLIGAPFTLIAGAKGQYVLEDAKDEVVVRGTVGELSVGKFKDEPVAIRVAQLEAHPGQRFSVKRIAHLDAVSNLQTSLTIEEKSKQSGIVSVTLEGPDKTEIRTILANVVNTYVQQNKDYKNEEARATLDSLGRSMPEVKASLERAEAAYTAFRQKSGTVDLDEQGKLLLTQGVDIQTRMLELRQKRLELATRYSDTHPAVVALDQSLEQLQAKQRSLDDRAGSLPETERKGLSLLREVRVNTELYTNLLNTGQQLKIVEEGQIGNVRVVDGPALPIKPVKPKRALVVALSLCVGLALGMAAPFAQRAVWGRLERSEELEDSLGIPVYAVVPHSHQQRGIVRRQRREDSGVHVLAYDIPEDITVDAIRSLRTTLHLSASDNGNNVVMVTSSQPGAGKSFLCANLSALFASGGKRVLLIDADVRRGTAHRYFGVSAAPGLPDAIKAGSIDDVVHRSAAPGVDVLTRGVSARSSELFNDNGFKDLLETASKTYDIVVVDTAPVLALHDAAAIGRLGMTTLLCVRHARSSLQEIREVERRLRNAGIRIGGVVLNDVPRRQAAYGGYGKGYYAYETEA